MAGHRVSKCRRSKVMCTIAKLAPSPSHLKTEDAKLAPSPSADPEQAPLPSHPKIEDAKLASSPSQPDTEQAPLPSHPKTEDAKLAPSPSQPDPELARLPSHPKTEDAKLAPSPSQPKRELAPLPSQPKPEDVKLAPLPNQPGLKLATSPSQPKPEDVKRAPSPNQPEPKLAPSLSQPKPDDDVDIEVSDESDDDGPMIPTEKDLETDEAVLALYRKCDRVLELHRTEEEMRERFCFFKKKAANILRLNKNLETPGYALSIWCDLTDGERHKWHNQWPDFKSYRHDPIRTDKKPKKSSWSPKAKNRWEKMMQMRLLRKQQRLEETQKTAEA